MKNFIWLSFLFFCNAALSDQNIVDIGTNPSLINDFLTEDLPVAHGHPEFFRTQTPESSDQYTRNIEDDELNSASQKGSEFRNWYLARLRADFSSIEFGYITRFEHNAYKRILELLGLKKQTSGDRPISDFEAEQRALYTTIRRFMLPSGTTLPILRHNRYGSLYDSSNSVDTRWEEANLFFDREFYKALMHEEPGKIDRQWNLHEIKKQIIKEVQDARARNFVSAIQYAAELGHVPNLTVEKSDGSSIELGAMSKEEIEQAIRKVSFLPTSRFFRFDKVSVKESFSEMLDSFFDYFSLSKRNKDHQVVKDFYMPREYSPKWMDQRVTIRLQNGRELNISEKDFSKWLNSLRLPGSFDLFVGKTKEKRYLIEASKRDALLADLEQIIKIHDKSSVQSLLERLKNQMSISEIPDDRRRLSLTEEIRSEPDSLDNHFFNNIRWSGLAVHPDFWRMRHKVALNLKKKSLNEAIESSEEQPQSRQERKDINSKLRFERSLNRFRTSSRTMRRALMWAPFFLWAGAIAGTTYGTVEIIQYVTDGASGSIPSSLRPNGQNQTSFWDTNGNNDHYIVPNAPGNGDGYAPLIIEVVEASTYGRNNMPTYYNVTDTLSLPQEVLLDDDPNNEPSVVSEIPVSRYSSIPDYDLKVEVNLKTIIRDGRVGLLSLPGYRISAIDMVDNDGDEVYQSGYKIYENPRNGMAYAEINYVYSWRKYVTYEIEYVRDDRPIFSDNSFELLNENALMQITSELKHAGAPVLRDELYERIRSQANVGLSDINHVFREHGYYTYREVTSSLQQWGIWFREIAPPNHPFTSYNSYSLNGELWQQCSASNSLLVDYLNWYTEVSESKIEAMPIHGFLEQDGDGLVYADQGHRHTLVAHTERDRTFFRMDATPINMDPEAQQQGSSLQQANRTSQQNEKELNQTENETEEELNQKVEVKQEHEELTSVDETPNERQEEQRNNFAILPKRIKPVTDRLTNGESGAQPSEDDTENASEKSRDVRKQVFLALQMELRDFGAFIEGEASRDSTMSSNPSIFSHDGINVAAYLSIVTKLMGREITVETAFIRLKALSSSYRNFNSLGTSNEQVRYANALRDQFNEAVYDSGGDVGYIFREIFLIYREKLEQMYERIESTIIERGDSPVAFLLSSQWRSRIDHLSSMLENLDYSYFLEDEVYAIISSFDHSNPGACRELLNYEI